MNRAEARVDGLKVAKLRLALPKNGKRHVSQATLAGSAGLHWVTVSNIERGKAANTTIDTLGRLAQALGCEIGDLLSDENGQPTSDDDEEDPAMREAYRLFVDLMGQIDTAREKKNARKRAGRAQS